MPIIPIRGESVGRLATSRILRAFNEARDGRLERNNRDDLLPAILTLASEASSVGEGSDLQSIVDAATAVAFAAVEESPYDRLFAVLSSAQLLLERGDFARVAALRNRARVLASDFAETRPFLSASLESVMTLIADRDGRLRARDREVSPHGDRAFSSATFW
jgi:hypothetical protein